MSAPISASSVARPRLQADPQCLLKVGGFTPFTTTDYPGKLAAVVFVQGCPWRCGYCHNPHLQSRTADSPLAWPEVIAFLKRRVGLIDAVVFSGGEATMDAGLEMAVREVRALGFGIGLHTAGMYPRRLQAVLPWVDWVGMDIKATPEGYTAVTGVTQSALAVWESAKLLLASCVAHEFRTTVHPHLHSEADILKLAKILQAMGIRDYAVQVFRDTGCADPRLRGTSTAAYPDAAVLAELSARFSTFTLRTH